MSNVSWWSPSPCIDYPHDECESWMPMVYMVYIGWFVSVMRWQEGDQPTHHPSFYSIVMYNLVFMCRTVLKMKQPFSINQSKKILISEISHSNFQGGGGGLRPLEQFLWGWEVPNHPVPTCMVCVCVCVREREGERRERRGEIWWVYWPSRAFWRWLWWWMIECLINWLIVWLIDSMTDWWMDRLGDWLIHSFIYLLFLFFFIYWPN